MQRGKQAVRRVGWAAVVAAMALGVIAAVPAASSGAQTQGNTLTIKKVVVGAAASGTVFTVTADCRDAGGTAVYFDAFGHPSDKNGAPIASNAITVAATDSCTFSEPVNGGASSVAYSCATDPADTHSACSSDRAVTFTNDVGAATVTVTNTFPASTADLVLTKTGLATTRLNVAYQVTVTNTGPGTSEPVTVSDAPSALLTLVSAEGTGWICTGTTTLTCTHDALDNGESASFTVTVSQNTSLGTFTNCASIIAGDTSDAHDNDEACTGFTVVDGLTEVKPPPPITVSPNLTG